MTSKIFFARSLDLAASECAAKAALDHKGEGTMTDEPKTFDLDGLSCVLVLYGGVEKLKTMDCDEIERLLAGAWNTLACSGELLTANCLIDLVSPIILERERVLQSVGCSLPRSRCSRATPMRFGLRTCRDNPQSIRKSFAQTFLCWETLRERERNQNYIAGK